MLMLGRSPRLPAWAQTKLDVGWRLSVQWRLTNRNIARRMRAKDSGVDLDTMAAFEAANAADAEEEQMERAKRNSMLNHQPHHNLAGANTGAGSSGNMPISLDSDEEEATCARPKRPASTAEEMREAQIARLS